MDKKTIEKEVLTDKYVEQKEYRKQYYLKNKENILKKKQEKKLENAKTLITLQETKLDDITKTIEENKYNPIKEGRTKLSKIKADYRILKAFCKDKTDVEYNKGTYPVWIILLNDLVVKNKEMLTENVLQKYILK